MARNNGRDGIPRIGRPAGSAPTPSIGDLSADSGPIDIGAVRRDEEFIEAIRGDGPVATDNADEYQLALLLANWRAEITAPALPAGPDLDEVAAAVDQEIAAVGLRRTASRTRPSLLRPVAGAAAAIALVMGGLVVFSYNSAPGDPLWSVKSVVFAQQADSTVAQIDTTSKLEQAEQLIASGDVAAAQQLLDGASATTGAVTDQAQRSDLEIWLQRLIEQLQAIVPTIPTLLPPAEDPGVVVPVAPEGQVPTVVPPTSVPEVPPVSTLPTDVVPPVSTAPVTPPSSEPAPAITTPNVPTILREPSPTTATASGSGDGSTPQSRVDTLDNGG
jgi:hypothetical protein